MIPTGSVRPPEARRTRCPRPSKPCRATVPCFGARCVLRPTAPNGTAFSWGLLSVLTNHPWRAGDSAEPRRPREQPSVSRGLAPSFGPGEEVKAPWTSVSASEFADEDTAHRGHRFAHREGVSAEPVATCLDVGAKMFGPRPLLGPVRLSSSSGPLGRYARPTSSSVKCLRPQRDSLTQISR